MVDLEKGKGGIGVPGRGNTPQDSRTEDRKELNAQVSADITDIPEGSRREPPGDDDDYTYYSSESSGRGGDGGRGAIVVTEAPPDVRIDTRAIGTEASDPATRTYDAVVNTTWSVLTLVFLTALTAATATCIYLDEGKECDEPLELFLLTFTAAATVLLASLGTLFCFTNVSKLWRRCLGRGPRGCCADPRVVFFTIASLIAVGFFAAGATWLYTSDTCSDTAPHIYRCAAALVAMFWSLLGVTILGSILSCLRIRAQRRKIARAGKMGNSIERNNNNNNSNNNVSNNSVNSVNGNRGGAASSSALARESSFADDGGGSTASWAGRYGRQFSIVLTAPPMVITAADSECDSDGDTALYADDGGGNGTYANGTYANGPGFSRREAVEEERRRRERERGRRGNRSGHVGHDVVYVDGDCCCCVQCVSCRSCDNCCVWDPSGGASRAWANADHGQCLCCMDTADCSALCSCLRCDSGTEAHSALSCCAEAGRGFCDGLLSCCSPGEVAGTCCAGLSDCCGVLGSCAADAFSGLSGLVNALSCLGDVLGCFCEGIGGLLSGLV